jgi:microcystin-dependent protein
MAKLGDSLRNKSLEDGLWRYRVADLIDGVAPVGSVLQTARPVADTNYLLCDGSAISRTTYSTLFSAVTLTLTGDILNGSPLITNLSSSITGILNGGGTIHVEGSGIPAGATVSAAGAPFVITISANATATAAGVSFTFYFYGNGDGSTTFNVPDMRQRFPLGKATSGTGAALGSTGGAIDMTVTIPAHYHGMGTGADLTPSPNPNVHTINEASTSELGDPTFGLTVAGSYAGRVMVSATGGRSTSSVNQSMGGRIGLVTGGVDGNANQTSGSNNPAYCVMNYEIRYQ